MKPRRRWFDLDEVLLGNCSFASKEIEYISGQRIELISAAEWRATSQVEIAERIAARLDGASAVYLAIDIDGLDAFCASGTGYAMAGGPAAEDLFALQGLLYARLAVGAIDITEIAPSLDRNDQTSFLGVQIVLETLALLGPGRG